MFDAGCAEPWLDRRWTYSRDVEWFMPETWPADQKLCGHFYHLDEALRPIIINLKDKRSWGGLDVEVTLTHQHDWKGKQFMHAVTNHTRHIGCKSYDIPCDLSDWRDIHQIVACANEIANLRGSGCITIPDVLFLCSIDDKQRFDIASLYNANGRFMGLWMVRACCGHTLVRLWPAGIYNSPSAEQLIDNLATLCHSTNRLNLHPILRHGLFVWR